MENLSDAATCNLQGVSCKCLVSAYLFFSASFHVARGKKAGNLNHFNMTWTEKCKCSTSLSLLLISKCNYLHNFLILLCTQGTLIQYVKNDKHMHADFL